ncbi:hypothetical protein RFI_36372 [Reticulomyxa filosa]|nr:hypothetical protein RFI_36372 [Reticulomyxa filosa]|eukprot:ETO01068.1 hypothetical protein RFI_36372 [Reticulomyxa filosa]
MEESACLDKLDENHDIYLSICRTERSPYRTFRFMLLRYFDSDKRKQQYRVLMASISNYDGVVSKDGFRDEKKVDINAGNSSPLVSPLGSPISSSPTLAFNKLKLGGPVNASRSTPGNTRQSREGDFDHFDIMLSSGFEVSPMKDDSTSTRVSLYWQLTGESVMSFFF